jgi:hypothetical protein
MRWGGGAGSFPPPVLTLCSDVRSRIKYTISYVFFTSHEIDTVVKSIRHRMSNTNTYDIVYDINLRHRTRHVYTNLRCRMLKVTYDVEYDIMVVGLTSYVTSHVRRRMYDPTFTFPDIGTYVPISLYPYISPVDIGSDFHWTRYRV